MVQTSPSRQTDRHTDTQTHRHTDTQTDTLTGAGGSKLIPTCRKTCSLAHQGGQQVNCNCVCYNDSWKEMLERVSLIFPDFNSKSEEEKFIYIISTKDVELINITSKYLQDVNTIRRKI